MVSRIAWTMKHRQTLIVPIGTQIVIGAQTTNSSHKTGTVGRITEAPTDNAQPYTVELIDGTEIQILREQFSVRKQYQQNALNISVNNSDDTDLSGFIIYRCIVGSRAYGLDHNESDTDRRGIYLPPANAHWSLTGVPEQLENKENEECYWELQKFLVMALKAQPQYS